MSLFSKILNFIFGETRKVESTFFGQMVDAGDYFECRRIFAPTGKIIECGVETDSEENMKTQTRFFQRVENDFEKIISVVRPHLEKEVLLWDNDYTFKEFLADFEPVYLFIPNGEFESSDWRISFENHPINHYSAIEMKGFEFKSMHTDG